MAFFEWKDSFNIGVAEIDRQHRQFLEYLNELSDLSAAEKSAPVRKEVIAVLRRHAETHFIYEEKLFEVIGYSETDAQVRQHEYFMSRVLELDDEQLHGDAEKLSGVIAFLRDWFLNHVLEADRRYVPYVEAVMNR